MIGDLHGTPEYRAHLVGVLTGRAVAAAAWLTGRAGLGEARGLPLGRRVAVGPLGPPSAGAAVPAASSVLPALWRGPGPAR